MDGYTLLRKLRVALSESSTGTWLDTRFSYDCLYDAAIATSERTSVLTSTQSLTTVASQANYTLNADYLKLYLTDTDKKHFIKYSDGTNTYWIYYKDYDSIVLANQTTSVTIPQRFTIKMASATTRVTGTASASGAATNGECTLTDTSTSTKFSDISVGDLVHNTTDGSHGIVIVKTSNTALLTCMFDGTDNDWTSADAYIISPRGRFELYFDPAPSTASHTGTIYYVQKPGPVYSNYRTYNFPVDLDDALVQYGAWKYKYRDREGDTGDRYYKYWDRATKEYCDRVRQATVKKGYTVRLMVR